MWTCPKCNTPVEPPLTVCRNCGTSAEDAAPSTGIQADGASARSPSPIEIPPFLPVVPPSPPETFLTRAVAGAKAGAMWGAVFGSAFTIVNYMILTSFGVLKQEVWTTEFPTRLLITAVIFAAGFALLGALLRQVKRRKPPPW
jgi:hypothetical protein